MNIKNWTGTMEGDDLRILGSASKVTIYTIALYFALRLVGMGGGTDNDFAAARALILDEWRILNGNALTRNAPPAKLNDMAGHAGGE